MYNNLYTEIKSLSDKYASELRSKIDEHTDVRVGRKSPFRVRQN